MPRPCAVELHACCYKKDRRTLSEMPRRKAVASLRISSAVFVATNVRLHGARAWHHRKFHWNLLGQKFLQSKSGRWYKASVLVSLSPKLTTMRRMSLSPG